MWNTFLRDISFIIQNPNLKLWVSVQLDDYDLANKWLHQQVQMTVLNCIEKRKIKRNLWMK